MYLKIQHTYGRPKRTSKIISDIKQFTSSGNDENRKTYSRNFDFKYFGRKRTINNTRYIWSDEKKTYLKQQSSLQLVTGLRKKS